MRWLMMTFAGLVAASLAWPSTAAPPSALIVLEDGSPYYVPVSAIVSSGDLIRWDNPTPTHHTVTHNGCVEDGGRCLFDSGPIPPGAQFFVPGLPAGRYVYQCRIHPIMQGVLTVTDSSIPPQL